MLSSLEKDFRYINKELIALSDEEIAENRKRLEERDRLHLKYGMERLAAYWSIIDRLGPAEGSVLEIGTGRGVTAALLAKKYKEVTTVDISDIDIKTSMMNAAYEKVLDKISYCICDAADMPFRDGQFECSVSINGFHHFKDPSAVIGEMIRVTGGTVVLADFSESGFEIVRKIHKLDGEEHEEHESNVDLIGEIFSKHGYKADKYEIHHNKIFVVRRREEHMIIGVTMSSGEGIEGRVCEHLGQCSHFLIAEADGRRILSSKIVPNTAQHGGGGCQATGELMKYKVTHVISGGMGMSAQRIFAQEGISVFGYSGRAKDALNMLLSNSLGKVGLCEGHDDCH